MQRFRGFLLIGSALLGLSMGLRAQQTNVGNLTGSVMDATGAIVPGAGVVVVNTATNEPRSTVTTDGGIYSVNLLPVGLYDVTVTKDGFQKAVRTGIAVISGQTFTVNFVLQIGSVTQEVTVTGSPPVLNTTDTMQGTSRTQAEIQYLPISLEGEATRAAISSVQTLSGVNYNLQGNGGQSWMVVSRAAINGLNGGSFGYEIDGVEAGPGEAEQAEDFMAPVPDAVQEIRMTTSTDASQGFNGGVDMDLVTKSGSNQLHGSVFYYNRNADLEARNWFARSVGKDNQNEGGFTVGGPIVIPKVYNGRNRTFFFATMDVYRYATVNSLLGSVFTGTVPTVAERTGDFQDQLGAQIGTDELGRPEYIGEIYDPQTTRERPDGTYIRDPFTYNGQLNVIPPSRFSKVSQNFQTGYALPTSPGIVNNWVGPYAESTVDSQWYTLKLDHQISDKQHLTFELTREFPWGFPSQPVVGCAGDHAAYYGALGYTNAVLANTSFDDCRSEYRYMLGYTWTVNPTLLLDFRAGVTRDPKRDTILAPAAAANGGCAAGLTGTLNCRTPLVSIDNVGSFGYNGAGVQGDIHSQRTPFSVGLSWSKGKHLYQFGVQYVAAPFINSGIINTNGSFDFSRQETGLPGFTVSPELGVGYASFLLGEVDNASVSSPIGARIAASEGALYAQDKWQVTHKLTVNYGLRWELTIPDHEHQNKISSFDPSIPNPGAGGILGALTFWGVGGGRNGMTQVGPYYLKAFAPKIGLSYAINDKTVFRANFGISYFPYWAKWFNSQGDIMPQYGFAATLASASVNSGITPAFSWDSGFPLAMPAFPDLDPTLENNQNVTFVDTNNNRPPMVENVGAELERQLPGQILFRAAYVGNFVRRLYTQFNLDQMPFKYLSLGNLLNEPINSPAAIAAGIKDPYPGFTGDVSRALQPYPQYLSVGDLGGQLDNENYNSLQINVQRHFGGFTFLANATLSKELDESSFPCGCWPTNSTSLEVPYQIRNTARSLAGMDIAKQMNLSWYWDVPVGTGKHFLGSAGKVTNAVLSNWRFTGIQSYQSGFPISVASDLNQGVPILAPNAANGCGSVRPSVPGQDLYLNPAAFREVPAFTIQTTSVLPSVRACGYFNEDLGVDKGIPFSESRRVSVGGMFTNLFNRHQFNSLNTSISSPGFGQFGGASFPRTIQLYMKLVF